MKVCVTGALGHIGSRFIRELPEGSEAILLDNLATQRYCSLFHLPTHARYHFIQCDVVKDPLERLFEGCDAVVHFAALTEPGESHRQREIVEEVNFQGTVRVGNACAAVGVPLVYISTTSLYSPKGDTVSEECDAVELIPQSPYADSKLRGELALRDQTNLRHVTLRFGTIVGASPGMRFHTAVNRFVWLACNKKPITVWRTALEQKRPYLCLDDGIRAVNFVIQRALFNGDTFNVVTENTTVQSILSLLRPMVGELSVELVESPLMNELSYDVLTSKIRSAGFDFRGSLRRSIQESVSGFLTLLG